MPGTHCAVSSCTNSLIKTKKLKLDISYHSFPKDEATCRVWVAACNRIDQWNPRTSTICSQHFAEEDFVLDYRSQLMNIKTRRKLQPNAIPTLSLTSKKSTDCKPRYSKKREMAIKLQEIILKDITTIHNYAIPVEDTKPNIIQENEDLKLKYQKLKYAYNRQQKQLRRLQEYLKRTRKMKREVITVQVQK